MDSFDEKIEEVVLSSWLKIHKSYEVDWRLKWLKALYARLIKWGSIIAQVDLSKCDKNQAKKTGRAVKYYFLNHQDQPPLVTIIYRWFLMITSAGTLALLTIGLSYNWKKVNLRIIRDKRDQSDSFDPLYNQTIKNLQYDIDFLHSIHAYVGEPYRDIPWFAEMHEAFFVDANLACYFGFYYINKNTIKLDMSVFGIIIEKKLYLEYYSKVVVEEANKCLVSSRKFVTELIEMKRRRLLLQNIQSSKQKRHSRKGLSIASDTWDSILSIHKDHLKCRNEIGGLLVSGELLPLHRRPNFCYSIIKQIFKHHTAHLVHGLGSLFIAFHGYRNFIERSFEWVDLVTHFFYISSLLNFTFLGTYLYICIKISAIEMTLYSKEVRNKMKKCIILNELLLREIMKDEIDPTYDDDDDYSERQNDSSSDINGCKKVDNIKLFDYDYATRNTYHYLPNRQNSCSSKQINERSLWKCRPEGSNRTDRLVDEINRNILYILFHYKLFIRLLQQVNETLRISGLFLIQLTFIAFIAVSFGIDLIEHKLLLREAAIFFCFVLIICEAFFVPICSLNARLQELFMSLYSLMASIVAIEGKLKQSNTINHKNILNQYYTNQLFRELQLDNTSADIFVIKLMIFPCKFSLFFRWHVVVLAVTSLAFVTVYYTDPNQSDIGSFANSLKFF